MAVKFTDTSLKTTNAWGQLKNAVLGKSLYNEADYMSLSDSQKENYLLMLYQNNDALSNRLPEIYNSDYGDAQTRYNLLAATNSLIHSETNEYKDNLANIIDKQLNESLANNADMSDSWVKWVVDNKYDGNYAAFARDYSQAGEDKYAELLTDIPLDYELDADSIKSAAEGISKEREKIAAENDASAIYSDVLKNIKLQIKDNARRQAYEEAGWLVKTAGTYLQMQTLWQAELVEIVEGFGDCLIGAAGYIVGMFGADTEWAETAVKYDWWAPETWMMEVIPYSYLSPYAGDNVAKWIHEIGINIVDMTPLALNTLVPGLGSAIYYTSSAGRTFEESLNEGMTYDQAFWYTAGATAIEYATEKISGNMIFGGGLFDKWEKFGDISVGTKIIKEAVGEGLEEVVSGIGSDLWHGAITGDITLDTKEGWAQIAKSFAIGGLVGGIMAGGSSVYENAIVSGMSIAVTNANGQKMNVSAHQMALVDQYIQRVGKKIEAGKTVSDKDRTRFDTLKNLKVETTDIAERLHNRLKKRKYSEAAIQKALTDLNNGKLHWVKGTAAISENYYNTEIKPGIAKEIADEKAAKDAKKAAKDTKKANKMSAAEEAAKVVADSEEKIKFEGDAKRDLAAYAYNLMSEEERASKMQSAIKCMCTVLGKMYRMFGEDTVIEGLKAFANYELNTIDSLIEFAKLGTDESSFSQVTEDTAKLGKAFKGSEFIIVAAKAGTVEAQKLDDISKATKTLRGKLKATGKTNAMPQIKLFMTNGSTVSTSFMIDNTLYINAQWLSETGIDRVRDIVTMRYMTASVMSILQADSHSSMGRTLLMETVNKLDNPKRSTEIMLQEICQLMIFSTNNLLLKQLLAFAPDESHAKELIKYFNMMRLMYAGMSVTKAASLALTNIENAYASIHEQSQSPERNPVQQPSTVMLTPEEYENLPDKYASTAYRAFPFVTGKNGLKATPAKVQAMYIYMQQTFGFNKTLNAARIKNWAKYLLDKNNYDGDGYQRFMTELEKFQSVKSGAGNTRAVERKPIAELLNYYLDAHFGLLVFKNGVMAESELVTKILNFDGLEGLASRLFNYGSNEPAICGVVSDFITEYGLSKLPPELHNVPIYVTFDSTDKETHGITYGTKDTGMYIVINLADAKQLYKSSKTVGGMSLSYDSNGELVQRDGKFEATDYTATVSELAYVVGHEIGHCIGMSLDMTGQLDITTVKNVYNATFWRLSESDRAKFVESIKNWLLEKDGKVKASMYSFAAYLGVAKQDVLDKSKKAEAAIQDFISALESAKEESAKVETCFEQLATCLYFTGYANEMFANADTAFVGRSDIINPKNSLDANGRGVIVLETNSDEYFLQVVNGKTAPNVGTAQAIKNEIRKTVESTETSTYRIANDISGIEDIKSRFKVESKDLVNPYIWSYIVQKQAEADAKAEAKKAEKAKKSEKAKTDNKTEKKSTVKKPSKKPASKFTRSQCIAGLESMFNCTYNNYTGEFDAGVTSKYVKQPYSNKFDPNDNYFLAAMANGEMINTKNDSVFSKEAKIDALVTYAPKFGNRRSQFMLRLNKFSDIEQIDASTYRVNGHTLPLPDPAVKYFVADGRIFASFTAAQEYLSTAPVSKNANFDTLFNSVVYQSDIGKRSTYKYDTIYVTSDGTVYNGDIDMGLWVGELQTFDIDQNMLGSDIADNPEQVTYQLSRLLDEKKVVRLYREGDTWKAFGIPNKVQNSVVLQLRAELDEKYIPYIEIGSDRQLYYKDDIVEIHGNNWNYKANGFKPVQWNKKKWYNTICNIASIYGLTSLDDFKMLGFSEEFITAAKSITGLTDSIVLQYIGDASNTELSVDLLIENTPQSKRGTGTGDFKLNPNIRSIEDARVYWEAAKMYAAVLPIGKTYRNILELRKAASKALRSNKNQILATANEERCLEYEGNLQQDIFIQILNTDYSFNWELNAESLQHCLNYIGFYNSKYKRRKTGRKFALIGLEIEDDEGHTKLLGESEESKQEFEAIGGSELEKRFLHDIKLATELTDKEDRKMAFEKILQVLDTQYSEADFADALRYKVLNELEGVDIERMGRAELNRLEKKVDKYNEMEPNSPEALRMRRSFARRYESSKTRKDILTARYGKDYYPRLLSLLEKGGGTYIANKRSQFEVYKKKQQAFIDKLSGNRAEVAQRNLDAIEDMFRAFLNTDPEYPGWYENFDKWTWLTQLTTNPDKILKNYTGTQDEVKRAIGTTSKRYYAEIADFLTAFENDQDFKNKMAEERNAPTYLQTGNVRRYSLSDADVKEFANLPETIKNIADFPKTAQDIYNALSTDVDALYDVLNDNDTVRDLVRDFGRDFVYALHALYNDLTLPEPGNIVASRYSKKADVWKNKLSKVLGNDKKSVIEKFAESSKNDERAKYDTFTFAQAVADRNLSYRERVANRILYNRKHLEAGKPVTDEERKNTLFKASEAIKNYRWNVNIPAIEYAVDLSKIFIPPVLNKADISAHENAKTARYDAMMKVSNLKDWIKYAASTSTDLEPGQDYAKSWQSSVMSWLNKQLENKNTDAKKVEEYKQLLNVLSEFEKTIESSNAKYKSYTQRIESREAAIKAAEADISKYSNNAKTLEKRIAAERERLAKDTDVLDMDIDALVKQKDVLFSKVQAKRDEIVADSLKAASKKYGGYLLKAVSKKYGADYNTYATSAAMYNSAQAKLKVTDIYKEYTEVSNRILRYEREMANLKKLESQLNNTNANIASLKQSIDPAYQAKQYESAVSELEKMEVVLADAEKELTDLLTVKGKRITIEQLERDRDNMNAFLTEKKQEYMSDEELSEREAKEKVKTKFADRYTAWRNVKKRLDSIAAMNATIAARRADIKRLRSEMESTVSIDMLKNVINTLLPSYKFNDELVLNFVNNMAKEAEQLLPDAEKVLAAADVDLANTIAPYNAATAEWEKRILSERNRIAAELTDALKQYGAETYTTELTNMLGIEKKDGKYAADVEKTKKATRFSVTVKADSKGANAAVQNALHRILGGHDYLNAVSNGGAGTKTNMPKQLKIGQLSRGAKYRITTALIHAYWTFMANPKTDRSADVFMSDVMLALTQQVINMSLINERKNGERVYSRIITPEEYLTPVFKGGAEFTEGQVFDRIKRITDGELHDSQDRWSEAAERELRRIKLEKDIVAKYMSDYKPVEPQVEEEKRPDTMGEQLYRVLESRTQQRSAFMTGETVQGGIDLSKAVFVVGTIRDINYSGTEFEDVKTAYLEQDYPDPENYIPGAKMRVTVEQLMQNNGDIALYTIQDEEWNKFMSYVIDCGLSGTKLEYVAGTDATTEPWLRVNKVGSVVDIKTNRIILRGFDASDVETTSDVEFESDVPTEDDFVSSKSIASKFETDDATDFTMNMDEETDDADYEAKGSWDDYDDTKPGASLRGGLSQNTRNILNYIPSKSDGDNFEWRNYEFQKDNAKMIVNFTNSIGDMNAFVSKIEKNPSVRLGTPEEINIIALLNLVNSSVKANSDLKARAEILLNKFSTRSGRTLGMTKSIGLNPVQQLTNVISAYLNLSDAEKIALNNMSDAHTNAIGSGDYALATRMMNGVLDIIREHRDELPVSMNFFEPGLSPEQRKTRFHNLAERLTSWRYFAMLGSPSTFFVKNLTSNVIITGFDAAAEAVAKVIKIERLEDNYVFDDNILEPLLAGDGEVALTASDVAQVVKALAGDEASKINAERLTKTLNHFIHAHYKINGKMPTAKQVAAEANTYMRKQHYQYNMNVSANDEVKTVVKTVLDDSGLLDSILEEQVDKHDRGYEPRLGKLRDIVLNQETALEDISEADAAVLADVINRDAPFGRNPDNFMNKWYRFIFKAMNVGDRKFMRPKIAHTVEKLVASNMTAEELDRLRAGDKAAVAKFHEFVKYAADDAATTYFRSSSKFQEDVMRLLKDNPVAQVIFGTLIPFPRMLMNTMKTAISYSPFGFVKAAITAGTSSDSFRNLKVNKEIGKAAVGTTALLGGILLALAGILRLDEDDEYGGVQLVIGNKVRFALQDLSPSALPFVIGATIGDRNTSGFWNRVYGGTNALLDATLLGEAIEIFGGNKKGVDVITDTFSSFINQFMPSALRHVARTIDPTAKQYSNNKGAKIIQRIVASIPGASFIIPAKIDDYTGDNVYLNAGSSRPWAHILAFANMFSPMKITADIESAVERESTAVGAPTQGPSKVYSIGGVKYTIPDNVYYDYQKLRAQLYSKYAKDIINTEAYKRLSINQKKLKLQQLQTKATTEARKQLNIGK